MYERLHNNPGMVAWGAMVTSIVAYDYHAIKTNQQTMTQAFHLGVEHPIWRFMFIGSLGLTTLHLANVLPRNKDIFYLCKSVEN